jgi:hypothetical protein
MIRMADIGPWSISIRTFLIKCFSVFSEKQIETGLVLAGDTI